MCSIRKGSYETREKFHPSPHLHTPLPQTAALGKGRCSISSTAGLYPGLLSLCLQDGHGVDRICEVRNVLLNWKKSDVNLMKCHPTHFASTEHSRGIVASRATLPWTLPQNQILPHNIESANTIRDSAHLQKALPEPVQFVAELLGDFKFFTQRALRTPDAQSEYSVQLLDNSFL